MRLIFSKNHLQKDFCKRLLRLLNFKHWGKIMDSVEHNGFVQEWKTFLANIEEVGKRKLRGRYGNA
jgi:hypothetical protein